MNVEMEIRLIKRDIENIEQEIAGLKIDHMSVRNDHIKDCINDRISTLNHRLERREFKLWKINR